MDLQEVERGLLQDRIAEIQAELHTLEVTREILYSLDEGLVVVNEDGQCFPGEIS